LSYGAPHLSYKVVIDDVSGGEVANILRGYILVGTERIRFTGIAYGRIGGQNVFPRLSTKAKIRVGQLLGDVAKFEEDLQIKLFKGEFELKPRKLRPT
jgi:hypothetical protein